MATSSKPQIRQRDINASVGGIRFDSNIIGWDFKPSIGVVARDIDRLGMDIRSMKEPLVRSVKNVLIPSIKHNFTSGGRPPWEPLAADTVKLRGGSSWPILVQSGRLRRAAGQFNIWTVTETSATVKSLPSNVWYGKLHQEGFGGFGQYIDAAKKQLGSKTKAPEILKHAFSLLDSAKGIGTHRKIAIPQRRFIMFQEDDLDEIQEVFADWLLERAIKVGRFTK